MGAFIVGLIIPLAIQLLRLLWNTGVRGRKDIEDYTSMPILGEIPLMKDRDGEQAIVVEENKTSSVAESFRLLRSNMDSSLLRHGSLCLRLLCRAREKVSFPAILP